MSKLEELQAIQNKIAKELQEEEAKAKQARLEQEVLERQVKNESEWRFEAIKFYNNVNQKVDALMKETGMPKKLRGSFVLNYIFAITTDTGVGIINRYRDNLKKFFDGERFANEK